MPTVKDEERILNIVPSKDVEDDWNLDNALEAGMLAAPAALPQSVDLREKWWDVGDQGKTGSCVGWGIGEGVLRWHFVKANRIGKKDCLSPRYIWMAAKETDEFVSRPTTFIESDGTSLKSALDIARKYGTVLDSVLPFDASTLFVGHANSFYAIASQLKISSYFNLVKNLNQWRTWLVTTGPILTALNVDRTWRQAAETNGILDNFQPTTTEGGHCVSVVGYRADGSFIIRNSWGTNRGDKGFAYASEAYIQAGFFNEAYGINL